MPPIPKRKTPVGSSSRTLRPRRAIDQHEVAASNGNLSRKRGRYAISASSTTAPPADIPGSESQLRHSSPLTATPTEFQSPAMADSNLELSPELLPPVPSAETVIGVSEHRASIGSQTDHLCAHSHL